MRPASDYRLGSGAAHVERRREYLRVVVGLLVQDLGQVAAAWPVDAGSGYARGFVQDPDPNASLQRIFTGLCTLSGEEMASERMAVAIETRSQEDGQSCFAGTSLEDLIGNADGLLATYTGTSGGAAGPGPCDLVAACAPALDARIRQALAGTIKALRRVPGGSFSAAVQGPDGSPGRTALGDAMQELEQLRTDLVVAAHALGITVDMGTDNDQGRRAAQGAGEETSPR